MNHVNKYRAHQNLLNQIKLAVQGEFPNIRMFDRHVGMFYTAHGTPVKINKKGMADLYALVDTVTGLIHVEIEIKSGQARQSKDQKKWQSRIELMGGLYILGRSSDQVIDELKKAGFLNRP